METKRNVPSVYSNQGNTKYFLKSPKYLFYIFCIFRPKYLQKSIIFFPKYLILYDKKPKIYFLKISSNVKNVSSFDLAVNFKPRSEKSYFTKKKKSEKSPKNVYFSKWFKYATFKKIFFQSQNMKKGI